MNATVTAFQLTAIGLGGLWAWRVFMRAVGRPPVAGAIAARLDDDPSANVYEHAPEYRTTASQLYTKGDRMAKAQIFARSQILDAKLLGVSLRDQSFGGRYEWLAAAYLTGAAQGITIEMGGQEPEARDVTAFLLTHNLSFKTQAAIKQSESGGTTQDKRELAAFQSGLAAAETWVTKNTVPHQHSLYNTLQSYARD